MRCTRSGILITVVFATIAVAVFFSFVPLQTYRGDDTSGLCDGFNIRVTPGPPKQTRYSLIRDGGIESYQLAKQLVDPCWGDKIMLYFW